MSSLPHANRIPIAFVGQMPPPHHGQAIANQVLASGVYRRLTTQTVATDMSHKFSEVGKWSLAKTWRLVELRRAIRQAAATTGGHTAYYSMGFLNLVGAIKNTLLLRECRKHFRQVIVHLHTGSMRQVLEKLGPIGRSTFGRVFQSVDAWILLAPELNDFGTLFSPRHVYYLPNGVHVPDRLGAQSARTARSASDGPPCIVFMSNLFASKGTDLLIRAGGILRQRDIAFRMRFIGSWPSAGRQAELQELVDHEGITHDVELLGPRFDDEKWRLLESADIFCMPTHFSGEAMPLSIIEAMACGLPIVSTQWRAIPSLVTDGDNGFLAPCQDVEALVSQLTRLLQDPGLRQHMGQAARNRFLAHHTIQRFHEAFEEIMIDFAPRHPREPH